MGRKKNFQMALLTLTEIWEMMGHKVPFKARRASDPANVVEVTEKIKYPGGWFRAEKFRGSETIDPDKRIWLWDWDTKRPEKVPVEPKNDNENLGPFSLEEIWDAHSGEFPFLVRPVSDPTVTIKITDRVHMEGGWFYAHEYLGQQTLSPESRIWFNVSKPEEKPRPKGDVIPELITHSLAEIWELNKRQTPFYVRPISNPTKVIEISGRVFPTLDADGYFFSNTYLQGDRLSANPKLWYWHRVRNKVDVTEENHIGGI